MLIRHLIFKLKKAIGGVEVDKRGGGENDGRVGVFRTVRGGLQSGAVTSTDQPRSGP